MGARAHGMSGRVLLLCVWAVWTMPTPGSAQGTVDDMEPAGAPERGPDAAEAEIYKSTVDQAIAAFRLRDLDTAQRLFSEAHARLPSARTLRGLGVVAFERARYVEAAGYLDAALRSQVRPLDADLRESSSALLRQAEDHIGHLRLLPSPADARVLVDGVSVAPGEPLPLDAGEHAIELQRAGHRVERRELRVEGRADMTFELTLRPLAPPPAPRPPSDTTNAARARWYRSPWLWSAVAIVVAGSGAAMVAAWAPRDPELHGGDTDTVVGR